jgi:hypothetical protein
VDIECAEPTFLKTLRTEFSSNLLSTEKISESIAILLPIEIVFGIFETYISSTIPGVPFEEIFLNKTT